MSRIHLPVIAAVALTLGLGACTGGSGGADRASEQPAASAEPASGPLEPVGRTPPDAYAARPIPPAQVDAAIAGLDGIVDEVMQRTGVPGVSAAVVRGGKTVYAKGFGLREVGKTDQVDPDTVFQVASLSKSISSTCVSAAVSKDLVKWSDRVTTYLPDFRLSDPQVTDQLTIADLFSHRSGLPATAGDDLESFGFDRATMVTRAGGELSVTIGPKKLKAPLTHYHGDTFSWLAPGGNGDPVSAVTFTGGGDRAQTLEIELLQIPKLERKD